MYTPGKGRREGVGIRQINFGRREGVGIRHVNIGRREGVGIRQVNIVRREGFVCLLQKPRWVNYIL